MIKITSVLSFILFFSFALQAQTLKISGSVNDPSEKKAVQNVVVVLLTPKDSVLYKFTRTNDAGKYFFNEVKPGNYIMMFTHPYFADLIEDVEIKGDIDFPPYALISKAKIMQEVIVKSGSALKIRGDTTMYTADSFKVSANANVEELLKKLPGIQVDKDGKIKAMGETVEKILVDGEEFFGDDPGMAVKNLRADAVKEVQVFDKKSDQAEFTGIDDGKTQKTINLKLKEDKKKGYFGKVDVSAGPQAHIENRYNNNLLLGSFKGKRKLSAFLLNGNTGQDGLSWQDEQKYGSGDNMTMSMDDDGGMMFMWRGGNTTDEEPNISTENGYLTNVNAGIQYSNKYGENHTINFSPKYNFQSYNNFKHTYQISKSNDSTLVQNTDENSRIDRHNFKLRGIYDVKIDSMNTLKLTMNSNFYHTQSWRTTNLITTNENGVLKNTSNNQLNTNNDKSAFSGNLIFKHKFKMARRTLTLTSDWNSLNSNGKNFLRSVNNTYLTGGVYTISKNQMIPYDKTSGSLSTKLIYTEPLGKKLSLELSYQLVYNHGNNDQLTYEYNPASLKFETLIDSLSNQFRQSIIQNIPAGKLNFANKKLKINVGSGFGFTNFDLKDVTMNKDYVRSYVNFYPTGNLTYTYKANKNIRINYNGNTTQPTIMQLQPLRNNNDEYNQYLGNPDLKPSFSNAFNISHNSYNFIKDIWMYQSVNLRLVSNSITNERIIRYDSGKTITRPINTNGNISVGGWGGFGFKIKKIDTRFNMNANINYNKYADVINSKKSFSETFAPGFSMWLSKSKEKKYDVSVGNDFNYNNNSNAQNNTHIHYITNTLNVNATLYAKKVWSIITDYQYYARQKILQGTSNLNQHIINVRLQRTFKKDEFTAYVAVRDLLNQNIGIERYFNDNTFTETTNDRLKRYALIGFTWNFKNKATQK